MCLQNLHVVGEKTAKRFLNLQGCPQYLLMTLKKNLVTLGSNDVTVRRRSVLAQN